MCLVSQGEMRKRILHGLTDMVNRSEPPLHFWEGGCSLLYAVVCDHRWKRQLIQEEVAYSTLLFRKKYSMVVKEIQGSSRCRQTHVARAWSKIGSVRFFTLRAGRGSVT